MNKEQKEIANILFGKALKRKQFTTEEIINNKKNITKKEVYEKMKPSNLAMIIDNKEFVISELDLQLKELQDRIDKAIDYIEKYIGNQNYINSNYTEEYDNYFDVKFEVIDKLLNILKGDNK